MAIDYEQELEGILIEIDVSVDRIHDCNAEIEELNERVKELKVDEQDVRRKLLANPG